VQSRKISKPVIATIATRAAAATIAADIGVESKNAKAVVNSDLEKSLLDLSDSSSLCTASGHVIGT
jgi:hypothetical protein